ncbi:cache domain-containing sensor histidine kinase [Paenibacillus radicis (ex Gao et al. 2016)]|uniref:Histidine kinase n=1 Tax=Paenibacillus radicis (ex Gao et al. 2016) TaxID=1737354 RepID=A0A917GXV5_9BACL|nr:sensor histidine kinase [Paenibacillus radicis (ex Gao et al. 2016)]GGG60985.1 histidine kinase [Paenibacillus radicis (ex Gao et al. 2016)]
MRLWLEKQVIRFTRGMNLRSKVLVMYGLILVLPTLVLGGSAIYLVIQSFHQSYLTTVDEAVRQTAQNVDFGKKSYDLLAVRTATDGELISRLGRSYADMTEILDTVNYVDRTFLITSKYLPGIADFRIYHTNETLVQDGQLLWRPEKRSLVGMDEQTWYEEAASSDQALRWSNAPSNPKQIVITRKIMGADGSLLGMVYILLNYDSVFGELLDKPFKGAGNLFVVDSSRHAIAATETAKIGNRIVTKEWPMSDTEEESAAETDGSPAVYDLTPTKELLIAKPLSSGWEVVAQLPMQYMDSQNRRILLLNVSITALFLLCSLFLIMTIVKNMVWRIRKLGTRMSDLSRGQFEVSVRHNNNDELGDLESMFNSMSERLGKLVEDITKAGLMEKEQAFKALQAQINPHFIYNSLSLLRWRALDVQDEGQIQIIDALTTFYRLALNNQISVIRIRDELEHVKAYLDIHQFRYPDRVRVEWDVDSSVLDFYTIKTVLQPIVENCYLHGAITRKKDAFIRVSVNREGDNIRMSILDNGNGIAEDVLNGIEAGTHIGKGNGFGTANIKERLSLYFGSRASFIIESEAGEWTRVSIVFPASAEQPAIRREI